jgi:hypothetical protein
MIQVLRGKKSALRGAYMLRFMAVPAANLGVLAVEYHACFRGVVKALRRWVPSQQ